MSRVPQGQAHRHHGRKPLGDRRDGEADGDDEQPADRGPGVGDVRGESVPEEEVRFRVAEEPDDEDERADPEDGGAHDPAELVELALQRRRLVRFAAKLRGDPPEFRLRSCSDGDPGSPTVRDGRSGKRAVHPVSDKSGRIDHDVDSLPDRRRFTGQRRLVDPEVGRPAQAEVGRDDRPGLEQDDVPWDDFSSGDFDRAAVSQDSRARCRQLLQRFERRLGSSLLESADPGVEKNDGEDDPGFDPITQRDRKGDRSEKDQDDHTAQLGEQTPPKRRLRGLRKLVGAVLRQSLRRLLRGQPRFGIDVELSGRVLDRDGVRRARKSLNPLFSNHAPPIRGKAGHRAIRLTKRERPLAYAKGRSVRLHPVGVGATRVGGG